MIIIFGLDSELGGLGLQTSLGPLCDCKRSLSFYKYGLILGSISCDSCVYIQTSSTFYKMLFQCGVVMVLAQGSLQDALLRSPVALPTFLLRQETQQRAAYWET